MKKQVQRLRLVKRIVDSKEKIFRFTVKREEITTESAH